MISRYSLYVIHQWAGQICWERKTYRYGCRTPGRQWNNYKPM